MKDSQQLTKKKKTVDKKTVDKKEKFAGKAATLQKSPSGKPTNLSSKKNLRTYLRQGKNFFLTQEKNLQLILIPLILLGIFLILFFISISLERYIKQSKFSHNTKSAQIINPYPVMKQIRTPVLSANAAIILESASGVTLFSKNKTLRFSMASTTKIMTALISLEYYKNDSIITCLTDTIEGSRVGLKKGDALYFPDMLYGLLLPSGNDVAYALAENYPGGVSAFVARMNAKAKELNLYNTHFADPDGLNDDWDYTTVYDLARLASYAMKNKAFSQVVGTKTKVITTVNGKKSFSLLNLNKLLGTDGITGIKTGTTDEAGQVLVTSEVEDNHTFILIVMQSDNRFADTKELISLVRGNIYFINP